MHKTGIFRDVKIFLGNAPCSQLTSSTNGGHIGIGPSIPLAQFLKIDQNSALIFTGIVSLIVLINYTYKLFPTIEDVERKSYGTIFYCISLFVLIYLFWDKDPYALISGFFIMTFGDGLAGLIGKSFDSKSWIFFKQKKS